MPPALPNSPPGWKPICPKVSPSSPCHSPTNSDCAPATLWNGSTRNSSAAPASPASSPMKPPSCAWSPPCSMNSATNGKPPKFTSPWKTIPSPQFDAKAIYRKKLAPPIVTTPSQPHSNSRAPRQGQGKNKGPPPDFLLVAECTTPRQCSCKLQ